MFNTLLSYFKSKFSARCEEFFGRSNADLKDFYDNPYYDFREEFVPSDRTSSNVQLMLTANQKFNSMDDKDRKFLKNLRDYSYGQGVVEIMGRVMADEEASGFGGWVGDVLGGGPVMRTAEVEFGKDGFFKFEGLYHVNILDPATPHDLFKVNLGPLHPHGSGIHARMRLVACHGRGAIVKDHQCELVVIVNCVD